MLIVGEYTVDKQLVCDFKSREHFTEMVFYNILRNILNEYVHTIKDKIFKNIESTPFENYYKIEFNILTDTQMNKILNGLKAIDRLAVNPEIVGELINIYDILNEVIEKDIITKTE